VTENAIGKIVLLPAYLSCCLLMGEWRLNKATRYYFGQEAV